MFFFGGNLRDNFRGGNSNSFIGWVKNEVDSKGIVEGFSNKLVFNYFLYK